MIFRDTTLSRIKFLYFLTSLIALIFVAFEIYLNLKHSSICKTEGCALTHIFDTYGILNYLGFFLFLFLLITSFLDLLNFYYEFLFSLRTYLLVLAVIIEGYFLGFQLWFLNVICEYCLTIASFVFLCFLLDFVYSKNLKLHKSPFEPKKEKNYLLYKIGILGGVSIFLVTYVVKLPLPSIRAGIPIIIYHQKCPHCRNVISYANSKNIKIETHEIKEMLPLAKTFNWLSVPILIYRSDGEIIIIRGANKIKDWLNKKYGIEKTKENKILSHILKSQISTLSQTIIQTNEKACSAKNPCE